MTDTTDFPTTRVPAAPYSRPTPSERNVLRLDGNEGDYPPSLLLRSLASLDSSSLREYPDFSELQQVIAKRFRVDPSRVVITAGADDAIDRVCRSFLAPGDELLVPVPTFEMIHRFAAIAGGTVVTVPWRDSFPTESVTARIRNDTTLVAIVSPNNPTGLTASLDDLKTIAAAARSAYVLLDHAYVDYADDDLTAAAIDLENAIVIRTFSKAWGLAGCRVGYAIASEDVANVLRNAGNPYPVSALSMAVVLERIRLGGAALTWHVGRVRSERKRLREFLQRRGVSSPRSEGNFVFAELGERAQLIYEALVEQGVLARYFPDREETTNGIRISLPGEEPAFDRLLKALGTCLTEFDRSVVAADLGPGEDV